MRTEHQQQQLLRQITPGDVTQQTASLLCDSNPRLYEAQAVTTPDAPQFSSVAQSRLTACNPMDCSTPGFPVHHQLPEFTQTHVH